MKISKINNLLNTILNLQLNLKTNRKKPKKKFNKSKILYKKKKVSCIKFEQIELTTQSFNYSIKLYKKR